MEVLKFLEQIPLPILVVALVILVAITVVMAYQYAKMRGMDGIQGNVYQLILKAETQVGCKPGTRTLTKVDAGFYNRRNDDEGN